MQILRILGQVIKTSAHCSNLGITYFLKYIVYLKYILLSSLSISFLLGSPPMALKISLHRLLFHFENLSNMWGNSVLRDLPGSRTQKSTSVKTHLPSTPWVSRNSHLVLLLSLKRLSFPFWIDYLLFNASFCCNKGLVSNPTIG